MSLIKLSFDIKNVGKSLKDAATGSAIKSEAHRLENSTLTSLRRMPTLKDKLQHFGTTKSGLKSIAPTAGLYGGSALALGGAAAALKGKKKDA